MSGTATSPVRHVDIEALAGLLAVTLGSLLGGDVDDRTIAKLTRKFDQVGLLARTGDTAPSAGQLGVALEGCSSDCSTRLATYLSSRNLDETR